MDEREAEIVAGLEVAGEAFRHCPSCGSTGLLAHAGRFWTCPDCGFQYFHNVAAAAGVVIEMAGGILFLVRAHEPAKGGLALPGGFIDAGERAEDAAIRECREEIGWPPPDSPAYRDRLRFIGSFPNLYHFRGMPYATCDLFFSLRAEPGEYPVLEALGSGASGPGSPGPGDGEAESLVWHPREAIPFGKLAFRSAARALEAYLAAPG